MPVKASSRPPLNIGQLIAWQARKAAGDDVRVVVMEHEACKFEGECIPQVINFLINSPDFDTAERGGLVLIVTRRGE